MNGDAGMNQGGFTIDPERLTEGELRKKVFDGPKEEAIETFVANRGRAEITAHALAAMHDALRTHLGYDKNRTTFNKQFKAAETAHQRLLDKARMAASQRQHGGEAFEGELANYRLSENGLAYFDAKLGKIHLANDFKIIGMIRDEESDGWALALQWDDEDGVEHRGTVPQQFSSAAFMRTIDKLTSAGLVITPGTEARERLARFLAHIKSIVKLLAVDTPGWVETEGGLAFVLPGGDAIGPGAGAIYPVDKIRHNAAAFRPRGTLQKWKDNVAAKMVNNSRGVLAMSTAFAGPLLHWPNEEGRLVHLFGDSGSGKTTFGLAAASIWSNPDPKALGVAGSWNSTANAQENFAASANDLFRLLDEMAEALRNVVGRVVYMFVTGLGKGRMNADSSARRSNTWRLMSLSTGEVSLRSKMIEDRDKLHAGQERRCISVPADAGKGMGVVEDVHGDLGSAEFIHGLREAAMAYYGTAGREYLERLVADIVVDEDGPRARIAKWRDEFMQDVPATAGTQAVDVARVFGLVAAAGELAIHYGIVPWPPGEVLRAALVCFEAWLGGREAGLGQAEAANYVARVREAIRAYRYSRFIKLYEMRHSGTPYGTDPANDFGASTEHRPNQHYGYWEDTIPDVPAQPAMPAQPAVPGQDFVRKAPGVKGQDWVGSQPARAATPAVEAKEGEDEYWIFPGALAEICEVPTAQVKDVGRALRDAGVLIRDKDEEDQHLMRRLRLGKQRRLRMYCISGRILNGE